MGRAVDIGDGVWVARFRADPAKVRVGIRWVHDRWMVTVESRTDPTLQITASRTDPEVAVTAALNTAYDFGIIGVDLGMCRTYDHPWGALSCPPPPDPFSILVSAIIGGAMWCPAIDAVAVALERLHGLDPDAAEAWAVMMVQRHRERRESEVAS